jgi:4-amino-4-deoxy-L-arabinose transferase-like glycosyltransferase
MPERLHLQRGATVPVAANDSRADWSPLVLPLALMAALWTFVPAFVHTAPPLDVVESALWGREWVVGTYKHPAMPGWMFEISRWFDFGRIGWPAYLGGQLFNLATLALTFLLARDLAGVRVAVAAVLATLGIEYLSWRSVEFNHNLAQMPFWIGSAWVAWRAVERGTLDWWLALGAVAAAGLYGKLSNAMLLLVIAGWILSLPRGRASLKSIGPWAGAALFVVVCIPLVHWLVISGFAPLSYAEARGREQTLVATLLFPANAALQAAPIVLTLAIAGFFARDAETPAVPTQLAAGADRFLWLMALAPPLLSAVLALLGGSGLRASWLAPALPLMAILLVARWPGKLDDAVMTRLRTIGIALAVLIPLGYGLGVFTQSRFSNGPLLRVSWPQAEIASTLSKVWTDATGKPLRIVTGRAWSAGLVALDHPDRPSIFTEGELAYAPWITPERLARDGTLVVWSENSSAGITPAMQILIAGKPITEKRIPMPRGKPGAEVVMKYVIIAPK